ncbi:hypothetical protein vBEcoMWL3_gp166 [Escherichia phage vB_EcoM_WL-3]|nr:hypothetical protein vBEcoMWL3_gp166 [Escherichia phage vB_EcoM_WL-3]
MLAKLPKRRLPIQQVNLVLSVSVKKLLNAVKH